MKCACNGGRWWVVLPALVCNVAILKFNPAGLILPESFHWPVMIAAISVYFTVSFMFNRGGCFVELRSIGLSLIGIGIMIVALQGISGSIGPTTQDRIDDVLSMSHLLCAFGLAWMVLYWMANAAAAIRSVNSRPARDNVASDSR